jgi:branched-chain amino acid transport system permease protein
MNTILQAVVDSATLGSLYAIFGLGIALTFGIMQLLNMAYGDFIMVGAFTIYLARDLPWPVIIVITVLAVILVSLITERVAFRPIRGASDATLLITSFAVSFFLQSLARLVFGSLPRSANFLPVLSEFFTIDGIAVGWLSIVTIALTALILLSLATFLRKTDMGMRMRASAENFTAAQVCGVNATRVIRTAFILSGGLAALASVLLVSQTGGMSTTMGVTPVLFGFAAAVIGGLKSLPGSVLGGYLLGIGSTILAVILPYNLAPLRDPILFALVFMVLFVKPDGLLRVRNAVTRV